MVGDEETNTGNKNWKRVGRGRARRENGGWGGEKGFLHTSGRPDDQHLVSTGLRQVDRVPEWEPCDSHHILIKHVLND